MRKNFTLVAVLLTTAFTINSCSKKAEVQVNNELSPAEVALIKKAGLSSSGATKVKEGYLIEGDILLTQAELSSLADNSGTDLVVANTEQYRTTNLVTGLPRTITVRYTGTRSSLSTALTNAVSRYNALGLRITLQKVGSTSSANITVSDISGVNYVASAGFPTSTGNAYSAIRFNTTYATWNSSTLTTVIAHELGHCIGFRHTDYMNRQYSCGGSYANEGSGTVGAIHIPGTPSAADPNSWMLACIGNGVNRPFNANDKIALNYLY